MAFFNYNRFPTETCSQNIQWNNSPIPPSGSNNCVQPFQRQPTPTFRPQQHEGFPQYSGQNRPSFSNIPTQVHPQEFNMLPPNNQVFNANVNAPQNFVSVSDHRNFVRTPDPQTLPRTLGPQNFPGAPSPQNFSGAQNFAAVSNTQPFSVAPSSQHFSGVPNSQCFSGASTPQNFPGSSSTQNFPGAPSSQTFFRVPGPQSLPSAPDSQNFQTQFYPPNFPRVPNPQNFQRPPDPQNFPRPPDPQNFHRPPDPQNFPRPLDPQNFSRPPNPQNIPGLSDPQNFPRPLNAHNFPRALGPQNFQRPPDPQNFLMPGNSQNFPRPPDPQNFPPVPDQQNFSKNFNSPNFPTRPNFHEFPRTPGTQNFSGVPSQPNFQEDANTHNFSRGPNSQSFPRAPNSQGFQRMPAPQNFTSSPNLQYPPTEPSVQNFKRESSFDSFSRAPSSSPQSFTPWKQYSSEGQRTQFQNRSWKPNHSRQFRDYSSQENTRGNPKGRNFKKLKSWMTDELFAEVKKKNILYLKAKSSDEQTAWQEFRLQRNRVSSLIKEAKIKAGLIVRKIKEEDNREKPFSCDTCDRAFVTETDLQDHISQHITCDHVNCTFEAHPKIVALHKRMQHDTGYAERINKLKNAEEIKKWREERKRRFPTSENVKKRQAEQAEREARGEVLETKEFGKFKRRKEDNEMNENNQRRRGRRFKRHNDRRKKFTPRLQTFDMDVDSETDSDSDSHITLPRFSGMLSSTNSADKNINDTENNETDSIYPQANSSSVSTHQELQNSSENLLKSQSEDNFRQLAVPCSDSNSINPIKDNIIQLNEDKLNDSDDEAPAAEPIVKCVEKSILINEDLNGNKDSDDEAPTVLPINKSLEESSAFNKSDEIKDSGDEAPTVLPINKSLEKSPSVVNKSSDENKDEQTILPESSETSKVQEKVPENGYKRNNNRYNRYSRNQQNQLNGQDFVQVARKSSLLEKLLADDIRHERNVILQCIRHIVKNNFFGIENNTHK